MIYGRVCDEQTLLWRLRSSCSPRATGLITDEACQIDAALERCLVWRQSAAGWRTIGHTPRQ